MAWKRRSVIGAGVGAAGLAILALAAQIWLPRDAGIAPGGDQPLPGNAAVDSAMEARIVRFCGDCHAMPNPRSFARQHWDQEVAKGFEFYAKSGRFDLDVPPRDAVTAWFKERADEELTVSRPAESESTSPVTFTPDPIDAGTAGPRAVSHLKWDETQCRVIVSDMYRGEICSLNVLREGWDWEVLGAALHPARIQPVDLDSDGWRGLVVSDLGSFKPADHHRGAVLWLEARRDGQYESRTLQSGLGRVADVRPGDFDGDGLLDLIVAEFGWLETGRILLLRNEGPRDRPRFSASVVDGRHGAIHVVPNDLDGDGHLDFVALLSQEHETVVAFVNTGEGRFRPHELYAAGDPSFGSSGIELVDLDQDGDVDILHTAGDTFDSFTLKPWHGIRWLENRGSFPFEVHDLGAMPGAHRALAGDFDDDGDLDIAACALLPDRLDEPGSRAGATGLLWLEQVAPGKFERHPLATGPCRSAAMAIGDFDADGDLDLATGAFSEREALSPVTLWWNQRLTN